MDQTIETHNNFEYVYLFWLVWENNVRKLGCDLYICVLPMAIKDKGEVMCTANVLDLQSQIYIFAQGFAYLCTGSAVFPAAPGATYSLNL